MQYIYFPALPENVPRKIQRVIERLKIIFKYFENERGIIKIH